MRQAVAIARREILAAFVSPIAYFVIVGFFLLGGFFFFSLLQQFNFYLIRMAGQMMGMAGMADNKPSLNDFVIGNLLTTMVVVLVFLVPLLTMRIIAEDKRSGTFELLVTSPLAVRDIVIGKFLGVTAVFFVMLLALGVFPALLYLFSSPGPELGPILSGFLGIALCGLAFISLGMAVACFTENQVVAAMSAMVLLLILWVINAPAANVGGSIEVVLNHLSPIMHLQDFVRGIVTLKGVVYFFSLILFGLFLSERSLESYRWR
jgi:ABC-2 type transport system permease protein